GLIEEPGTLLRGQLNGQVQKLFDVLPVGDGHGKANRAISRRSQIRAVRQSRSTVASEMPSTWAISGADRPPKNFISTTLLWRSSIRDNPSKALSTATIGTSSLLLGRSARSSIAIL